MAKANKKPTKADMSKQIEDGFNSWDTILDDLIDFAEKSFMPLVATSLKLTKEIVEVHRKGFKRTLKEN